MAKRLISVFLLLVIVTGLFPESLYAQERAPMNNIARGAVDPGTPFEAAVPNESGGPGEQGEPDAFLEIPGSSPGSPDAQGEPSSDSGPPESMPDAQPDPSGQEAPSSLAGNEVPSGEGEPERPEPLLSAYEESLVFEYPTQQEATHALDPGTKVDLVFVIDDSGSMGSYINNVKRNITNFVKEIQTSNIELRIGIVLFSDPSPDDSRALTVNGSVWHKTYEDAIASLNQASIGGGNEPHLDALGLLTHPSTGAYDWNPEAIKHCILLTDEWTNTTWNRHGYTSMNGVIDDAVALGLSVSVVTVPALVDEATPLVEGTGGSFANLNDADYSGFFLDFSGNLTSRSNTYALQLLDQGGNALKNKDVAIAGQAYKTDGEGLIQFRALKGDVAVHVEGYRDYIFDASLASKKIKTIRLEPIGELGKRPYISSVHIKNRSDGSFGWKDMALDEVRTPRGSTDGFDVTIYVVWQEHDPGKVYLLQDNSHKYESSAGTAKVTEVITSEGTKVKCSKVTFTNQKLGTRFAEGKEVYASALCGDGDKTQSPAYRVKLKIAEFVPPTFSPDMDAGIFEDISVEVPDSIPLIGKQKVGLDIGPIKAYVEHEGDLFKAALGVEVDKKLAKESDSWWPDFKKEIKDLKKDAKKFKGLFSSDGRIARGPAKTASKKTKFWNTFTLSVELLGYIEWMYVNGSPVVVDANAVLKFEGKFGKPFYLPCAFPIYVDVSLSVSVKVNAEGAKPNPALKLPFDLTVKFDADVPEIGLGIAAGIKDVASAGVYGKGALNMEYDLAAHDFKLAITANASFKVEALCFTLFDWQFWEMDDFVLYSNYRRSLYSPFVESSSAPDIDFYDTSQTALMPRGYDSQWLGGADVGASESTITDVAFTVLQKDIFPNSKQQLVNFGGGQKMLVWVTDNTQRSSANRTMLVYSLYDAASGTWSEPKAIDDDGTADYYPTVATDGTKVYVAWHNSSTTFADTVTIQDVAASGEICAAVFSGGSFGPARRITNNTTLDTSPVLAVEGSAVNVVWTGNSANDIFGMNGVNTIQSAALTADGWSAPVSLKTGLSSIHSLDAALRDGKLYVAYAYDEDDNYDDMTDMEIYQLIADGGNVTTRKLTENDVLDSAPHYGVIGGETKLLWYSENNLQLLSDLDETASSALFEGETNVNDNYVFAQTGSNINYIVWPQSEDDHVAFYTAIYDGAQWSEPVLIGSRQTKTLSPSAAVDADGTIWVAFNEIEQTLESDGDFSYYVDGKTNLCLLAAAQSADISVSDEKLSVKYDDVIPENALPLDLVIRNNGRVKVDEVDIYINGARTEVQSVDLLPGQQTDISIGYVLPQTIAAQDLQIKVLPRGLDDSVPEDNTVSASYGFTELSLAEVKMEDAGAAKQVGVTIENLSYIDSGAFQVLIREDSETGNIVSQENIANLPAREYLYVSQLIDKAGIVYDEDGLKTYFIEIVTSAAEYSTGNNTEILALAREDNSGVSAEVLRFTTEGSTVNIYGAVYNHELEPQSFDVKIEALDGAGQVMGSVSERIELAAKSHGTIDKAFSVADLDAVGSVRIQLLPGKAIADFSPAALEPDIDTDAAIGANTPGRCRFFAFTPDETGLYRLASSGSADTFAGVYDATGALLAQTDDGGTGDNFELACTLTAGQTYYYRIITFTSTAYDGIPVKVQSPGTATIRLTRLAGAATHTVSYNHTENGGTPATVTDIEVMQGAQIDLTPTAQKEGWTFLGWNTDSGASSALTSLKMGGADVTLYAIFQKNLSVSFVDYSGTAQTTRSINLPLSSGSASITLPPQNTYTGWTSVGWALDTENTAAVLAKGGERYSVSSGDTLYGLYQMPVTLSYYAGGGTGAPANATKNRRANSHDISSVSDPIFTLGAAPTRSGYVFVAWAQGSTNGERFDPGESVTLSENTTFYAVWERVSSCTVSYDSNGGSGGPYPQTKYQGTTLTLSTSVPARLGFTFQGWATSAGSTSVAYLPGGAYEADEAITLYAVWQAAPSLLLDSETIVTMPLSAVNYNYTFTPDITGNYTFTAYEHSGSTVYLQVYDSSGTRLAGNSQSVDFSISTPLTAGETYYVICYHHLLGQTLTSKLIANRSYLISYNADGASSYPPSSHVKAAGADATLSTTLMTRFGYTFLGWATSDTATTAAYLPGDTYSADADLTLYAVWKPAPALTFNGTEAASMPLSNVYNYYTFTPDTSGLYAFTISGHTVGTVSMYLYNASQSYITSSSSSSVLSLTANLTAGETCYVRLHHSTNGQTLTTNLRVSNAYTISYDANGGNGAPSSQTKTDGINLGLASSAPTRAGYTFLGWAPGASAAAATWARGDIFTLDADTTLYAVWTNGTAYTVNYHNNGGTGGPSSIQYKASGATLKLSSVVPTRTNYTFLGWATTSNATEPAYQPGGNFDIDANTTLYAIWQVLPSHAVTYDANGGTNAPNAQTKYQGNDLTLRTNQPTRVGYAFRGWATSAESNVVSYLPGAAYTADAAVALYAVWQAATPLSLGFTYTNEIDFGDAYRMYSFAPATTGAYAFTVSEQTASARAYLYNASGSQLAYTYSGSAFTLTYELTAGETYYFRSNYASGGQTGSYKVKLTPSYKITYDAGEGTGAPAEQSKADGDTLVLRTDVPTRMGYTFMGWGTSPEAGAASYVPGGEYTANANATLYAVWQAATALSLDTNYTTSATFGGQYHMYQFVPSVTSDYSFTTSGQPGSAYAYLYNSEGVQQTYGYSSGTFSITWALTAGETYYIRSNFSYTAQLGEFSVKLTTTYRVSYDANGGENAPAVQNKPHDEAITLQTGIPTRFGHNFLGWSTSDTAASVDYKPGAGYAANENLTLYAVWGAPAALNLNTTLAVNIELGGDTRYLKFTPRASGTYRLESSDSISVGKRGFLYDASGTLLTTDSSYNGNFAVSHALTAGETYYYMVQYYYSSNTGSFNVRVGTAYSVVYDANGGSNAPSTQYKQYENTLELSSGIPARFGHSFLGWATSDDAAAVPLYLPGEKYLDDADMTLYAVWEEASVLSPGTEADVAIEFAGQTRYFKFTPGETATYRLSSLEQGTSDPYGELYNSGGGYMAYNNDAGYGDTNFTIAYNLEAGQTYYLAVRMYNSSATGAFKVRACKTHTVTYNANGGNNAPAAQYKEAGVPLAITTSVPTRFAYNFAGWATDSGAASPEILPGATYTADADCSYYAVWEAPSTILKDTPRTANIEYPNRQVYYTFTPDETIRYRFFSTGAPAAGAYLGIYNTGGGRLSSDYSSSGDASLACELNAGQQYYLMASLNDNTQTGSFAVAVTRNDYTVTFDANGGTGGPTSLAKLVGTDLAIPYSRPSRSGYTFLGWATSSTATTPQYVPESLYTQDAPLTLYAVWTDRTTYTVSFNGNGGGNTPPSQTKAQGVALTLTAAVPTRANYRFAGWATTYDAQTAAWQPGGSFTLDENTTLYAVWHILPSHTVTYNANRGGSAPPEQTKYEGTPLELTSELPVYMGREFLGWAESASGPVAWQPGDTFTQDADITLYAVWGPAPPALELNLNYTVNISGDGRAAYYLFTPAMDGYYFLTSYDNSSADPVAGIYDTAGTRLTMDDDGGNGSNFKLGYTLKAGHEYCYQVSLYSPTATASFKIRLTLDPSVYVVAYDANGGTGAPDHHMVSLGTPVTLRDTIPSRFGFAFLGWSTNPAAATPMWQPGDAYTDNVSATLYAVWRAGRELVNESSLNVSIANPGDYEYLVIKPDETREYRIFSSDNVGDPYLILYDSNGTQLGYSDDDAGSLNFSHTATLTAGKTYIILVRLVSPAYTGSFRVNLTKPPLQYTITFNANGGSVSPESDKTDTGGRLASLPTPVRSGYTFGGWFTQASGGQRVTETYVFTSSATIYARWLPPPPESVQLNKSYLVMEAGDTFDLVATTVPSADVPLTWVALPGDDSVVGLKGYGGSCGVEAKGTGSAVIKAYYGSYDPASPNGGSYIAAECRVNVVDAIDTAVSGVNLLQTRVSVNALNTNYTKVPLQLVLDQNQGKTAAGEYGNALPRIDAVSLVRAREKDADPGDYFTVEVVDDRYVRLVPTDALINAKKPTKVTAKMKVSVGSAEITSAQALTISISRAVPKLKAKSIKLNGFLPGMPVAAHVTTSLGSVTEVRLKTGAGNNNNAQVNFDGQNLTLKQSYAKAAKLKLAFEALVDGFGWRDVPVVTASVSVAKPSVKLAASSVVMYGRATLKLTGKDIGRVKGITVKDNPAFTATGYSSASGTFTLAYSGAPLEKDVKLELVAGFSGSSENRTLPLKLTVKKLPLNKDKSVRETLKLSKSTITLNKGLHRPATATVSVATTPADAVLTGASTASGDKLHVSFNPGAKTVTVSLKSAAVKKDAYKVDITTTSGKATLKVKVAEAQPSVTLKAKGSINVVDPGSTLTLTPTFKNFIFNNDGTPGGVSIDAGSPFEIVAGSLTSAGSVKLRMKPEAEKFVGKTAVVLTYTDSQGNTVASKAVNVTSKHTSPKLTQSAKTVSLQRNDVYSEGRIDIAVKSPAAATIDRVAVNAKYAGLLYARKIQDGSWAIGYKDNTISETLLGKNGKGKTTSIKLDVYMVGSARPVSVTVKITVG